MKKKWITKFDGTENGFLSNFHECQCSFEGWEYPTTEAAFQAAKTLDLHKRAMIQKCAPGAAKRMGRALKIRDDWEEIKDDVMLKVLRSKFKLNKDLREKLLATGDAVLIEGTTGWHDCYWGVCNCEECGAVGTNMLGTLLMKVRDDLRRKFCKECGEKLVNEASLEGMTLFQCTACKTVWDYGDEDPYNGA